MMMRVSQRALPSLPPTVRRPEVDRATLHTGIVHLGLGAFARAHLAAFTEPLLDRDPSWGICGVSLRSPATRDALAPQDFLYTCATRDGGSISLSVISVITGVLVAPEDPAAVVAAMAGPDVRIVTISVSERGYHRRAADGTLDEDDPLIKQDLRQPKIPRTVPGLIAAALRLRRANGVQPFTVLCCDNLPDNGNSTRALIARFARLSDPSLADFIANEVAFPNTVVDQIVPATTDADRAEIDAALGMHDASPVVCEPFRQWVIEDRFPLGRPAWERTGAEIVRDVRPYEAMKLRMLNGSHSAIAYLGQLAGWRTVSDAIADRSLATFIEGLMGEAAATLPPQVDLAAYGRALMARFANSALKHQTAQIARDGSQKLPMRLFATATARGAQGLGSPHVALAIAAWLRFLQGRADNGAPLTIEDPKKDALLAASGRAATCRSLCDAIFAFHDVVPPPLANATAFRDDVTAALEDLATLGVRGALSKASKGRTIVNGLKALITGLALVAVTALPALAQDVSAPDNSARINAIKKSGVLRVAVLANAPWLVENTTGGGEQWSGPAWLLSKEYAKRLGVKLEPVLVSHETKIPVLAANQVDISVTPLAETPERDKVVDFILYSNTSVCMFGRADNPKVAKAKSVDDLNSPDFTIAYFIGGGEEGWVKQRFPKAKLLGVANSGATAPLEDVMAKRADAAPINRIPYVPMSHKVKGLAVLPSANNCQDSTEKAQPVGVAIDKNQLEFLAWARAVAKSIQPQLAAAEQKVIETMK